MAVATNAELTVSVDTSIGKTPQDAIHVLKDGVVVYAVNADGVVVVGGSPQAASPASSAEETLSVDTSIGSTPQDAIHVRKDGVLVFAVDADGITIVGGTVTPGSAAATAKHQISLDTSIGGTPQDGIHVRKNGVITFAISAAGAMVAGGTPLLPAPPNLTLSASGLITDATRALALDGDGLLNDSSIGIWRPSTNLLVNGGFESVVAPWGVSAGPETLTRVTSDKKFGAACLSVIRNSVQANAGAAAMIGTLTAGQKYSLSGWVKSLDGGAGTFNLFNSGNGNPVTGGTGSLGAVVGQWKRFTAQVTCIVTGQHILELAGANMLLDGLQLEDGWAATPYIETNGAAASRSTPRLQFPVALIDPTRGWVCARIRPTVRSSVGGQAHTTFRVGHSVQGGNLIFLEEVSDGNLQGERSASGQTYAIYAPYNVTLGVPHTHILGWNADVVKAWVDGVLKGTASGQSVPASVNTAEIGTFPNARYLDGDVLAVAFGTGPLSDAEALALHNAVSVADDATILDRQTLPGACTGFYDMRTAVGV